MDMPGNLHFVLGSKIDPKLQACLCTSCCRHFRMNYASSCSHPLHKTPHRNCLLLNFFISSWISSTIIQWKSCKKGMKIYLHITGADCALVTSKILVCKSSLKKTRPNFRSYINSGNLGQNFQLQKVGLFTCKMYVTVSKPAQYQGAESKITDQIQRMENRIR